jgi:hypothetical protein
MVCMALKINKVTNVPEKDLRLIDSCLRIMRSRGFRVPLSATSGAEGANLINHMYQSQNWTSEVKNKEVRSLLDEAKQCLLPLTELDWFKTNDRACYFVWATLYRHPLSSAPNHPCIQHAYNAQIPLACGYDILGLKMSPSSSKERFEEVVKFFDRVGQPLSWQRDLIAHLKLKWGETFKAPKPFSWLIENNEEQCRWAWEYITRPVIEQNRPIPFYFNPTGVSEMYLAIYAIFDSWSTYQDFKRLFLIDFNKAWQQKKHRDNRQDKKACNIVLRNEVKQMLDDMAADRGMKLNQLIETLIENEYKIVRLK